MKAVKEVMDRDDRWERLQKVEVVRRTPMEKKLDNITKVIQNPDDFNVNIASRERIDGLEQRIKRLEELIDVQEKTGRKEK